MKRLSDSCNKCPDKLKCITQEHRICETSWKGSWSATSMSSRGVVTAKSLDEIKRKLLAIDLPT